MDKKKTNCESIETLKDVQRLKKKQKYENSPEGRLLKAIFG